MDKSIMAMADDILGGALSDATKASSAPTHNDQPVLPDLTDEQRESMIMESVNEKLGRELKPHAQTSDTSYSPGSKSKVTRVSRDVDTSKLSPKAKAKLKSHRERSDARNDEKTSWAVDRTQQHQRDRWAATRARRKAHTDARGVKTRGAKPDAPKSPGQPNQNRMARKANLKPASQDRMAMLKKKREDEEKRRRSQGIQARKPGMENSNLQILLQARDILREATTVGAIGTGPQMTASRAFSNHGADMGKDTVKVEPVDKSLRKVEKKGKKKGKKVKKESFDLFLDRIINETRGSK